MKTFVIRDPFLRGEVIGKFDAESWDSPIVNPKGVDGNGMEREIQTEVRKGGTTPKLISGRFSWFTIMDEQDEYTYDDGFEDEDDA